MPKIGAAEALVFHTKNDGEEAKDCQMVNRAVGPLASGATRSRDCEVLTFEAPTSSPYDRISPIHSDGLLARRPHQA